MMDKEELKLIERLNKHPRLRARVESLLNVVENTKGDCKKADAAEQHVIEELRKMGNEALQSWGEKAALKATEELRKEQPGLRGNGKKSLLADDVRTNSGYIAEIQ